jgi:hypothetical protein
MWDQGFRAGHCKGTMQGRYICDDMSIKGAKASGL